MELTTEEARNQAMEQVADYATQRKDQFIADKEAWKQNPEGDKPFRPFVVAAVVDKETGETYLGESLGGDEKRMLKGNEIHPLLADAMAVPSMEKWATENCAEFNAINDALQAGASPENLVVSAMSVAKHEFKEPCNNCQSMTERLGIEVVPTPEYVGHAHQHAPKPTETAASELVESDPAQAELRADLVTLETAKAHAVISKQLGTSPALEDIRSDYIESIKGAKENAESREELGLDKKTIASEYNKEVTAAQESTGERIQDRFSQIKGSNEQLTRPQRHAEIKGLSL